MSTKKPRRKATTKATRRARSPRVRSRRDEPRTITAAPSSSWPYLYGGRAWIPPARPMTHAATMALNSFQTQYMGTRTYMATSSVAPSPPTISRCPLCLAASTYDPMFGRMECDNGHALGDAMLRVAEQWRHENPDAPCPRITNDDERREVMIRQADTSARQREQRARRQSLFTSAAQTAMNAIQHARPVARMDPPTPMTPSIPPIGRRRIVVPNKEDA